MSISKPGEKFFSDIFNVSHDSFEPLALEIFRFQYQCNDVYRQYAQMLNRTPDNVVHILQIPFLPVSFFKTHRVSCSNKHQAVFESSHTSGQTPGKHYVADLNLYETSFTRCFELFFGSPQQYAMLFLLPSYLERKNASLAFMAEKLIRRSQHNLSGFFLYDYERLNDTIVVLEKNKEPYLLFGVAFALLDFSAKFPQPVVSGKIIETGGMKGRGREMIREELHEILQQRFSVTSIFSEYGMTELLSQAYLKEDKVFRCPPWMRVLARDIYNPFSVGLLNMHGALNIIDLANLYSCSFIETEDVGTVYSDGSFIVSGRMDYAEIRGCNLMID